MQMNDIKSTVAKNIASLRQAKSMTQLELAERLNYSDKAVSKWERGESLPDITVLVEIADLFGVPLDYLVRAEHKAVHTNKAPEKSLSVYRKGVICTVSVLLVWFIAVLAFVIITLFVKDAHHQWLAFIYAIPVSMIVWLVFNSLWFNKQLNYVIISVLTWTTLLSAHLTALPLGANIWPVYLLGIPGQVIIILCSVLKRPIKPQ